MPTWTTTAELLASRHTKGLSSGAVEAVFDVLEERIERFHARAWAPRTASEQLRGDGSSVVWLSHPACRSLTSVTVDGVAQDVADWRLWQSGRLERVTGSASAIWGLAATRIPYGAQVDVTYDHGADAPPDDLLDAALRATRTLAVANPRVGERTETLETPDGTTINFAALPDWQRGRPLGMPDIDMVINSYGRDVRPVIA